MQVLVNGCNSDYNTMAEPVWTIKHAYFINKRKILKHVLNKIEGNVFNKRDITIYC